MKTVIGFLDDFDEAEDLADDLQDAGITRSSIEIVRSGPGVTGKEEGGFFQKLKRMFGMHSDVPPEHQGYYAEGVRRGGVLVAATVPEDAVDRITDLMNDYGAVDIESRAENWKKSGWKGYDETAVPYSADQIAREREQTIPVAEESVKIGKRTVPKGGVRVYTSVIETPVEEEVSLREEKARVARRTVDRPVAAGEEAFKESSVEITESAEEPVVSKEARVKEEVVVGKESSERTRKIRETVRRTEVNVEGDNDFRSHFKSNYASLGGRYEEYEPAYRYADTLFLDRRYRDKDWNAIENDVRIDWEKKNPGTWDRFKGSIRYGWDRLRGRRTRKAA